MALTEQQFEMLVNRMLANVFADEAPAPLRHLSAEQLRDLCEASMERVCDEVA